ncbi:MAG: glycosyl hydrolase, partial [Saprospiraceae bacterium]|nr:glycosyl hydrolase [Saprospiraceae bacterium]
GESGWISQHPTNPDIFYAGSQGALLTRYDRSNGQIRDIQVYPRFFSGEPASALPERWQWTFPIMFAHQDPNVMYTCSQHIWKTTNDGQSWQKISPDLTYADPETLGKTGGIITMDMNGPEIYATVFALAPSYHDINTIWAGSDDGMVHITRDGGKNWSDITPSELPKYSRVSIIDESRHAPGTLYLAANRYQVDDRQPYVFRTTDYGKSWTKITTGIKDGHFARAVREDHITPGLLFLATEHGVYVSFDAGDHWQSIQLELPDTPIRDLVIKDDDVVLGSHGRGFWILDDINPLRAAVTGVPTTATLFKPSPAIRGLTNASVQYYLPESVDSVKFEIIDPEGSVIGTHIGREPEYKPDPNVPWWRRGGSSVPTTKTGINTFSWDMRYPGATEFDGMIIWSARPGRGPKAPLGTYQIRMTAGEVTKTQPIEIKMNPNYKGISQEDLDEQFALAVQIRDKTSLANETVIKIRKIKNALTSRPDKSMWEEEAEQLQVKLSEIELALYQVQNQSGQDPLNFPIKLNNRLASLRRSVENGDARPTDGAYQVFSELSKELDSHLAALKSLLDNDGKNLSEKMKASGLEGLHLE